MKFLAGLSTSIILIVICNVLNEEILISKMSDFFIGSISTSGYWIASNFYNENHEIK